MMNDSILLVCDKNLYFYRYEDKCVQPIKNFSLWYLVINKLCEIFNLPIPISFINKEILHHENILITDSAFSRPLYNRLSKYQSSNIYVYYMNTIDDGHLPLKKDYLITFDSFDAKKYDIHFLHTPYSKQVRLSKEEIIYDTVFLGRSKGRDSEILKIKKILDSANISNKFMVLDTEIDEIRIDHFVSYDEYLKVVSKSKVIIEINKKNQSGCSLRFMESLFFKRKLITNNINVVYDNYYHKENVYIIDRDERNISDFIKQEYVNFDDIGELDFSYWIENIERELS